MSNFHKETEHKAFAMLFDSCNIEDKYKNQKTNIPYFIVKDKEEKRIFSMVQSAADLSHAAIHHFEDAVHCVFFPKSLEEEILLRSGLITYTPQGAAICSGCLAKAILICQEQLEVLKDIQEMSKVYESKL